MAIFERAKQTSIPSAQLEVVHGESVWRRLILFVLIVLTYLICTVFGGLLMMLVPAANRTNLSTAVLVTAFIEIATVLLIARPLGLLQREYFRLTKKSAILAVLVGFAMFWMMTGWQLWGGSLGIDVENNGGFISRAVKSTESVPLTLTVLLIFPAFVAPFLEEIIYRGAIHGLWKHGVTRVAVSTVLFTVVHLNTLSLAAVWSLVPIFICGLCFGIFRERTGSYLPSMLCHSAYNFIPVLFMIFYVVGGGANGAF